jgi:cytochrome c-type biogenesis protein CcmE
MSSQAMKIAISVVVIGAAATYLLSDTLLADPDALTYFHGADEVIAKPGEFRGKKIRMGGHVAKGSILQKTGTMEYQFEIKPVPGMAKHTDVLDRTVTVRYTGVVPDTFKDDAECIVGGSVGPDGVFQATDLVAKCPSKYEAEEKNKGTY